MIDLHGTIRKLSDFVSYCEDHNSPLRRDTWYSSSRHAIYDFVTSVIDGSDGHEITPKIDCTDLDTTRYNDGDAL